MFALMQSACLIFLVLKIKLSVLSFDFKENILDYSNIYDLNFLVMDFTLILIQFVFSLRLHCLILFYLFQ